MRIKKQTFFVTVQAYWPPAKSRAAPAGNSFKMHCLLIISKLLLHIFCLKPTNGLNGYNFSMPSRVGSAVAAIFTGSPVFGVAKLRFHAYNPRSLYLLVNLRRKPQHTQSLLLGLIGCAVKGYYSWDNEETDSIQGLKSRQKRVVPTHPARLRNAFVKKLALQRRLLNSSPATSLQIPPP